MSEIEQQDYANGIDLAAGQILRRVVQMFIDRPFPRVVARLGDMKVVAGDRARLESKVSTTTITDEYMLALGTHAGKEVVIFFATAEDFSGQKGPAKTDPDEPGLPFVKDEDDDAPGDDDGEDGGDGPEDPDPITPADDDGAGTESEEDPGEGGEYIADTDNDGEAPAEEAERQAEVTPVTDPEARDDRQPYERAADEVMLGRPSVMDTSGATLDDGPTTAEQIAAEAAAFEASAAELESQVTRGKIQAQRVGGTTEPKARRSRKSVTA